MDVFIEKIVAKKKGIEDYLFIWGIAILGLIACVVVFKMPFLSSLSPFFIVGIGYGAFYLVKMKNIEFEYAVTNGDLDIDRIIAQRSRKRIISVNCKEFDIVAKMKSGHFSQDIANIKNKIVAASSLESPDVYFVVLQYKGEKTLLFFEPDKRMLDSFKTYIPRKVYE